MKFLMFIIFLFSTVICYGQKTKLPEDLPMPLAAQFPLLGIAMERMFGSQESVCLNREPDITTLFLDKLHKRYPILYKEYFR